MQLNSPLHCIRPGMHRPFEHRNSDSEQFRIVQLTSSLLSEQSEELVKKNRKMNRF